MKYVLKPKKVLGNWPELEGGTGRKDGVSYFPQR